MGGVVGVRERLAVGHGGVVDRQVRRGAARERAHRVRGAQVRRRHRGGRHHGGDPEDVRGLVGLRDGARVLHRELGRPRLRGVLAGGLRVRATEAREPGEAASTAATEAAAGGRRGGDRERVAAQGADLVLDRLAGAGADRDQDDHRRDPDQDAQGGQRRAGLVGGHPLPREAHHLADVHSAASGSMRRATAGAGATAAARPARPGCGRRPRCGRRASGPRAWRARPRRPRG